MQIEIDGNLVTRTVYSVRKYNEQQAQVKGGHIFPIDDDIETYDNVNQAIDIIE